MRRDTVQTTDLPAAATELFTTAMRLSVAERGSFTVALSGGSTPLAMYERLAQRPDLPWDRARLFWGDERFVPHDHEDSNYGAAKRALLERVPMTSENVYPWPTDTDPERAAKAYAEHLEDSLGAPPTFDLVLLGLGEDGHTASLFPGTGTAFAQGLSVSSKPEGKAHPRLSLTANALSQSRTTAFLVSGEAKRSALLATLSGDDDWDRYPARAVGALERLVWLTDVDLLSSTR